MRATDRLRPDGGAGGGRDELRPAPHQPVGRPTVGHRGDARPTEVGDHGDATSRKHLHDVRAYTVRALKPVIRFWVAWASGQRWQLEPDRLLAQYRRGLFPTTGRFGQLRWHDPERRAILPMDDRFHVSRNVRQLVRKGRFMTTFNRAFFDVIESCARPAPGREWTWISKPIVRAYGRLHQLGHAHSFEVWEKETIVAGGYGVAIGGLYAGESSFTRVANASKVGLVHLVERLREGGFVLHDTQMITGFTRPFGVVEIPRAEYHVLLAQALQTDARY